MCVLIHHILLALNVVPYGMGYGGFGVGLFFVHTALVLMWSLERRPNTLDFYVRRVARIYPLAIVILLIAVATHARVSTFHADSPMFVYQAPTAKQFVTHLLLMQNFFSGNFVVYPMWSLPIEIQMYVLLPVLFFFLRKNLSLWPLLVMWGLAALFSHQAFLQNEINLAVSIPYFLPGVMAFVGFARWKAVLPGWSFAVALAVVVWVGGHAESWQRAWWPCLALGLMLPLFRQMGENVFTKLCWYVARYSYGIYLTHPFSLLLAFYVCRSYGRPLQFAVLFVSLAVFSVAAFHLIETPFMKLGARAAVAAAKRFRMPPSDDLSPRSL